MIINFLDNLFDRVLQSELVYYDVSLFDLKVTAIQPAERRW